MNRRIYTILTAAIILLAGCKTPKNFPKKYYKKNEKTLTRIEESYRTLYKLKPFSIEFTDKTFNYISLEMQTDSLKYIYEFHLGEPLLKDTLLKFGYNPKGIDKLIEDMRSIKCTWINNLKYYTDTSAHSLVFISIRPKALDIPFNSKRYYILTFYTQRQYYDNEGRLLDGRTLRRLRRVHDEIFFRITDKVCYTLSERFR